MSAYSSSSSSSSSTAVVPQDFCYTCQGLHVSGVVCPGAYAAANNVDFPTRYFRITGFEAQDQANGSPQVLYVHVQPNTSSDDSITVHK